MYQHNILEKYGNLIAGTSYRTNENSIFDLGFKRLENEVVVQNREKLFNSFSSSIKCGVFLQQIHSANVETINSNEKSKGGIDPKTAIPETDGIITNETGIVLCIQTADCLPVFIFDPVKKVIALLHAGWRGTEKKITAQSINKFIDQFNSNPKDLIVSFGPAIRDCCYEVSADFKSKFSEDVLYKRNGHYYMDLVQENTNQALSRDVKNDNILSESSLCTACNLDLFFSYRKEGESSGRLVSFLSLKD